MRYVKVTYERQKPGEDPWTEQLLAVGDIRQTPEEIVHRAFEDFYGDRTETVEDGQQYEGPGSRTVSILDVETIPSGEAESRKSSLYTKYVNRNITEKYAPTPYTGKPRPPGT